MRKDLCLLSTYLNAAVIALAILLGIWAKYDRPTGAPATSPAISDPRSDGWDEAGALSGATSAPL
jgi:hypothetical protein